MPLTPLERYVDGWRRGDADGVVAPLDEACVMVEPQGTVLRGRAAVRAWVGTWLTTGRVESWTMTEVSQSAGVITAKWDVVCQWQGARVELAGRTVAHVRDGRITYLREYASTGPLGDWDGTWRE